MRRTKMAVLGMMRVTKKITKDEILQIVEEIVKK